MRGLLCALALLLASSSAFAGYSFQIENNTASKIDAIVVSPVDPSALEGLRTQAQEKGTKWISYALPWEGADGMAGIDSDASGTFKLTILDVLGTWPDGSPILLVKALWIADFVVNPSLSTGKFAGANGSWVMYARSEPFVLGSDGPVLFRWHGEGKLKFLRRR